MKAPLQRRKPLLAGETQVLRLLIPGSTQNVLECGTGANHGILL
jgi:hypothetical protein